MSQHGLTHNAYTRHQSHTWQYDVTCPGYKHNMTDIQAAIGRIQLKRHPAFQKKRDQLVTYYRKYLAHKPWVLLKPTLTPYARSAHHLMSIRIKNYSLNKRNLLIQKLIQQGIQTNVHYIPLPCMTYYKKLGYSMQSLPKTNAYYKQQLSLPLYTQMTKQNVLTVTEALDKMHAQIR